MLVHRSRERSERWRRWIIAGIALTAGTVLSARQSATFRKATEIVPVHVTVRTNGGEIVRGLTAKDFEVFDNGLRREILPFSSDPLPVSVAILLDRSPSLDMYTYQSPEPATLSSITSCRATASRCRRWPPTANRSRPISAWCVARLPRVYPVDPGSPIWAGLDRTVSLFPDTSAAAVP